MNKVTITDLLKLLSSDWEVDILDSNDDLIISTYEEPSVEAWQDFLIHYGNEPVIEVVPTEASPFLSIRTAINEVIN